MFAIEIIAFLLMFLLGYIYLGYPALLWLLSRFFGRANGFDSTYEPTVTLVISAYNEEAVIGAKIENSLALEYPKEKLSIVVVSDCSNDGTDQRVLSYAGRGVQLVRAANRRGKTSALNHALELVKSEVVIFSDANALYDSKAIRYLVGHFVDARIGYVVGHARYHEESRTAAGGSEGTYWNLEVLIKECESRFSSVVGGDGAIYAIRRSLYEPMLETDINDFVNPLQIVAKGYRGVFERRAWCIEQPAGDFTKEFSRKVRIANRSFNALFRVPQAMNPFRVGVFAWELWSHKILRWLSPFFLAGLFLDTVVDLLMGPMQVMDKFWAFLWCGIGFAACLGAFLRNKTVHPLLVLPYYFLLMNIASAKGVLLRLHGRTIATWATVRQEESDLPTSPPVLPRLVLYSVLASLLALACGTLPGGSVSKMAALLLLMLLMHAYLCYPLVLVLLRGLAGKKIVRDDTYLPEVTLLVVAFNEELDIEQKLRNSLSLDYPREKLRIVVASDGSTDATNAIVSRYLESGVTLLPFQRNRGKISALNDAMADITSEIVVLSDANVNYHRQALRKLVRNFNDPRVGAVSGKVVLENDTLSYRDAENTYYGVEHLVQEREGTLGALIGGDGAMYAIRRHLFRPPPRDTILDDLVITMSIAREGYLVLHEKEAMGFEVNRLELAGEFRRKARIIAGGYQCLLQGGVLPKVTQPLLLFCFISHKVLRWLSGFLLLGLFGVLVQIEATGGEGGAFFAFMLACLLAVMLLAFLVHIFPILKGFRLSSYSHYFFMLMAASLVGCYLGMTGRQKVAWRGGTS